MSNTLAQLMEKNLQEVWSERDSARRKTAIKNIYAKDCTLFEENEVISGYDAINAKIDSTLEGMPTDFVFRMVNPARVNHNVGRLTWVIGPADGAPVATGMDIALFENGRISSLHVFLG
jgi:hypothetical protein